MPPRKNIVGQRFGRLTVISFSAVRKGKAYWLCICDCGNEIPASTSNLRAGKHMSCGCFRIECGAKKNLKHGCASRKHGESREYKIWSSMKHRCNNSNNKRFKSYGGRGIRVCERWENDFETFFLDMGRCSKGLSLDRIDNNGNYGPGNCRWATTLEQRHNQRPHVRKTDVYVDGTNKTRTQIAKEHNINPGTFCRRLRKGMTLNEALNPQHIINQYC